VLEASFAANPAQPAAHHVLFARLLRDGGLAERAEAHARAAVEAAPALAAARALLATLLRAHARSLHGAALPTQAIPLYREALALDDRDADAWNSLGVALTDVGRHAEARDAYGEALKRRPDYWQVGSNLLVHLHYDGTIRPETIFEAHRAWAARHAASLKPAVLMPRAEGTRRRIGFLSPAFASGPTATFVKPLFAHLDRASFEVVVFDLGPGDEATAALRVLSHEWHKLRDADDAAVTQCIVDARLDVLVDLAGHAPGGRPLVLARKPAPRIVTWLDYFDTTGLDSVDLLVGDPVSTPEGGAQRFTEEVVRIDPVRLCYAAPDDTPAVAPLPMERNRFPTFGSFSRQSKITEDVVGWWSDVLRAVPSSHLVVKNAALTDPGCRHDLLSRFAARGVDAARLDLRGPSPHAAMLAEYGDIDVALDTFPYNGGLTTCEALWMGVPVVTVLGEALISRQSAALLAASGNARWVGRDSHAATRIASALVSDPAVLAETRAGLRDAMARSPLMDGPRFAREFARVALG